MCNARVHVLRGSLLSQRDPQNNDKIGDPGSPMSWGPQNFMTPSLPFAMVRCSHQRNVDIKRKLQVWRVQKCIPLVAANNTLTCTFLQTTQSHISQCKAENENLRNSGSTFCHGTVFVPKQCLYQKEATGMESPKMHSSSWCKNPTYLCGTANYLVSCKPV